MGNWFLSGEFQYLRFGENATVHCDSARDSSYPFQGSLLMGIYVNTGTNQCFIAVRQSTTQQLVLFIWLFLYPLHAPNKQSHIHPMCVRTDAVLLKGLVEQKEQQCFAMYILVIKYEKTCSMTAIEWNCISMLRAAALYLMFFKHPLAKLCCSYHETVYHVC